MRDTTLDGLHWRASLIELDKLLAARKVAFKPLQSQVTDTIVLQFGKQDLMVEGVKLCNLRQKCRSFVNPSWEDKLATSRSGMFI